MASNLRFVALVSAKVWRAAHAYVVVGALAISLAIGTHAAAQTTVDPSWPPGDAVEAGASPWAIAQRSAARLISSRTALVSEAPAPRGASGLLAGPPLGIEFRMAPGWKTYWRSPGDAGLPAEVDWSGSENVTDLAIKWPLPERDTLLGYETLVYRDRVVLPVTARAIDPGKPVKLRAHVEYLVCEKLCVPAEADLALDLVPAPGVPTQNAAAIATFARQVPSPVSGSLSVERAILTEGRNGLTLEVTVRSRDPLTAPDLLAEGPRPLRFGRPTVELNPDRLSGVFIMPVQVVGDRASLGSAMPFTLTFVDRGERGPDVRALETRVTVTGIAASALGGTLGAILLLAST
jgi:suppressor for copper-sensitivity B